MPQWPVKTIEYVLDHWGIIALSLAMIPVGYMFIYSATLSRRLKNKYKKTNCFNCGYDLRTNTIGSCPECGHSIPFKQKRFLKKQ